MTDKVPTAIPLQPEQLCSRFDLEDGNLGKNIDRSGPSKLIGQDRAIEAIQLSARMSGNGFNAFVMGKPGHGRHQAVFDVLNEEAAKLPLPGDWVYTHNFTDSGKPVAMELPAGTAIKLKSAMELLVDDLANDIPAIFESDDYQNRRRAIEQEFGEKHEKEFAELMNEAQEKRLTLLRSPMGFIVAATIDGKPITPEQFGELSEQEKTDIEKAVEETQKKLERVLQNVPKSEKKRRLNVEKLNADMAKGGVDETIDQLLKEFGHIAKIKNYLETVRLDLIENAELFLEASPKASAGAFPVATTKRYLEPQFQRYLINTMISNDPDEKAGAPVITENLPTLGNLVGRIEHMSEKGTLVTNFSMIKPGALHKANGGYLVLDVRQVLSEPFAWETLKSCLQNKQISIISAHQRLNYLSTTTLEPDPIPLNLRVVLVGERKFYYLLSAYDADFASLFKIQVDFNDEVTTNDESVGMYVAKIQDIAASEQLRSVDAGAICRILSESSRLADDAEKLSLDVGQIRDILMEADYWAAAAKAKHITDQHIEKAITEAEIRASRPREHIQEAITRETLLIDTEGGVVGQINALSVHQIAKSRFSRPSRVTARVRMGKGKVVDIEREVELGGPLHSKGVLILSGYLATHFALDVPMSLWASIVFEQSYGGVDGDSASAAELICLLSALSGCPIDQSYSVTGSVNQHGQIQAIGGVNEKIEGFFDICVKKGLTGSQGVLIPIANVKHLALRSRVVDAVEQKKFSIIPIETIDQGIEILTGVPAGERNPSGSYPDNSINGMVEHRLREFAINLESFSKGLAKRIEADTEKGRSS